MNSHFTLDTDTRNTLIAIPSSIITNLIYDLLSTTSYVVKPNNTYYTIQSISNIPITLLTILSVFLLFILIWITLITFFKLVEKIYKQLSYNKIQYYAGEYLVHEYTQLKNRTIELHNKIDDSATNNKTELYLRDLIEIVSSLKSLFSPFLYAPDYYTKGCFRSIPSDIMNINIAISPYEYSALISLLDDMVRNISPLGNSNPLIALDCKNLRKTLYDLQLYTAKTS